MTSIATGIDRRWTEGGQGSGEAKGETAAVRTGNKAETGSSRNNSGRNSGRNSIARPEVVVRRTLGAGSHCCDAIRRLGDERQDAR